MIAGKLCWWVRRFWGDEVGAWFTWLLIGLLLNIVAYLIMPRPKVAKPEAAKDLEDPTAEAGRPIPVVFGTVLIKGLNILWFGDKSFQTFKVRA